MDELVLTQLREAQSDLQFMVSRHVCETLDRTYARRVTDLTEEMAEVPPVEPYVK